jgi:hypothetical protein
MDAAGDAASEVKFEMAAWAARAAEETIEEAAADETGSAGANGLLLGEEVAAVEAGPALGLADADVPDVPEVPDVPVPDIPDDPVEPVAVCRICSIWVTSLSSLNWASCPTKVEGSSGSSGS